MKNENQQLNIAVFGHKRIPSREGGVEIVVEELSTRMVQLGHPVTCYSRRGHHVAGAEHDQQKREEYKGVKVRSVWTIDRKGIAAATSSIAASVLCAFSRADVVHIHAEGPALMCWLPKLFGKRVIVTVHGLDWQRAKWKGFGSKYIYAGEKMAVRFADEIIVLSKNIRDYFWDTYRRRTCLIPNGVNKCEILPAAQITQQYGLTKDGYILFLGRIVPEKGVHYLIDAFKQVKTGKKLVIAGGSSDTEEYMNQLKARASDDPRILFTGFVQKELLEELYSNAYLYTIPSDLEGMPLTLLEAMSYGNCCLVSDIPECLEVVEQNALVFPRGDVKALRKMLQTACDDPQLVETYRETSADFICGKYNWDNVVEQTLALYR